MNRTKALMLAFGWQGGTIHQVAEVTGCPANELLYAESVEHNLNNKLGWFAYRTNSREYNKNNILEKYQGNVQFWLGVASGVFTTEKLGEAITAKF